MPKPKLSPLTWLLVAVIGYVIGITAIYFLLLDPLFSEVEEVRQESLVAEEYLVLQNTAVQLASFKNRVTARNRLATIRAGLDSLATPIGLEIIDVSPDPDVNEQLGSGFMLKGFRVTIEGQYPRISDFLTALEQPNNYYAVTNMTIIRIDERTGRARAQVRMKVLTVPESAGAPQTSGN